MRKKKDILFVLVITISILLASCGTIKENEISEEEKIEQVQIETFNDVGAVVKDAQDSVWDEIYRKAKEAEERRRQIVEALEEAERLEAEKNAEIEAIPEEITVNEEELDIVDVTTIVDITEEVVEESNEEPSREIEAQEKKELVRILEEEKVDEHELTPWTILKAENDIFKEESAPEIELKERDTTADRILYGNPSEDSESISAIIPEEEKVETSGLKVVNIYLPEEEKVEESQIRAEEILALGRKYESQRHQQQITDMGYEEIAGEVLKFLDEVWPILVVVLSLIVVIVLFVILGKKIINPKEKGKAIEDEGIELPAEGVVVVRPGAGESGSEEPPIEKDLLEKELKNGALWKPKVDTEDYIPE